MTLRSRQRPGSNTAPPRIGAVRRLAAASVVIVVAVLGLVAGAASVGSAGGWAVASVDAIPAPRAGATEVVGFTILQHGVTPVDLLAEPGNEVGIELVEADGSVAYFPAVSEGAIGHYVATVVFEDAGDHEWSIRMGWFGSQALGTVSVSGVEASSDGSSWPAVRIALSVLAATLVAGALVDLWSSRRRARLSLS